MINFDNVIKEETKEHNPNCPGIPDHTYRILIIGGYGSGKTNPLFNLINQQPDIDKIYIYAKDPYEAKYKFLNNKRESKGLKHFNDSKAFIEYSNNMVGIYKNIEDYNPNRKRKILIAFDDMIADMLNNKKLNPRVTELFIRDRKVNIPNKQEIPRIASHHSSNIGFKDFMNLYKKCTAKPYSFLVIDATLATDNPSRFRKNLLERM